MNPQKESKLVQYWADDHLIVSGNFYRLIDNQTNQQIFHCYASDNIEAIQKCINFSLSEWEKR